jgi:prepilin signal peptidase PulO-like enzyme (type II secretory pathway)
MKKNKDGMIPFGPFILIGALLVLYLLDYIDPFLIEFLSL